MAIILKRNLDGVPGTDFYEEVKRRAAAAARTGRYDFIYIVPTRRRVRELQRELVKGVTFGKLPVYTLELFAHDIFSASASVRRVISQSMQGMIVARVLSEGEFKFFRYASFRPGARKGVAPIGTIKKIVDQIDYLEENGITPEDYQTMASAAQESEKLKLEEFHRIYAGYLRQLGGKLVDNAGVLSLVNRTLSEDRGILRKKFPGSLTVFVEGFYNFKKPELDFLRLVSSEKRFSFLIRLDCNESNRNLFRTMISTSADLSARGFSTEGSAADAGKSGVESAAEFLASNLFGDDPPFRRADMREKVSVVEVRDSLREAEFVAERIKEIAKRNPGQKLDRICVASYLPQNYSRLFREVFRKYRVPANITDRYTLESNGVVNAILSFTDIKAADYERVTLMRAVTNRVLTLSGEFGADRTGSILYNAARLCRFERGLRSFRDSIEMRLEFMKNIGASDGEENADKLARDTDILVKARRILGMIDSKLSPFNGLLSPEEFRDRMKKLVTDIGIHRNIVRVDTGGISAEVIERDARALSAFFDVLDEVVDVEMERGGDKLPLAIWLESLRSALSLTRYNIRQKYGYGVYVTSLEEIRGLEFDYLFIVGLNEGELPAKYDPEIFLPLRSQEENRETEPYLQRHLFYQAASSFRKMLYLVFPSRRDEVKLARSSFIDSLEEVAHVSTLTDQADRTTGWDIFEVHKLIEADSALRGARERILTDRIASSLLPPNLERCMEAEAARYRGDNESEFAGRITDPSIAAELGDRLGKRTFSAAQLESMSRCGFRYFSERILGIADVPEIETSLSPVERGAVLHKILYRFYSELAENKKNSGDNEQLELLLSIGREVLDGLGISSDGSFGHDLFEVERETILGTAETPGTLELFFRKVHSKLLSYGFQPENFEVAFGMKGAAEGYESPVEIGGVPVRGKIDRIDSAANGLTIFDYKTSGRNATHGEVIRQKISPQLIIYLDALDKLAGAGDTGDKVAGAAFISINRNRLIRSEDGRDLIEFIVRDDAGKLQFNKSYESNRKTPSSAGYPETMDRLLAETESFVKEQVQTAKSGRFNLTRYPQQVCEYCPYIEACRISIARTEAGEAEEGTARE